MLILILELCRLFKKLCKPTVVDLRAYISYIGYLKPIIDNIGVARGYHRLANVKLCRLLRVT
jgi:hypothetical protein